MHGTHCKINDKVRLFSSVIPQYGHRKLHYHWTGPFKVIAKLSDLNYKIQSLAYNRQFMIVHFDYLKLCPPETRLEYANQNSSTNKPVENDHAFGSKDEKVQQQNPPTQPQPSVVFCYLSNTHCPQIVMEILYHEYRKYYFLWRELWNAMN